MLWRCDRAASTGGRRKAGGAQLQGDAVQESGGVSRS